MNADLNEQGTEQLKTTEQVTVTASRAEWDHLARLYVLGQYELQMGEYDLSNWSAVADAAANKVRALYSEAEWAKKHNAEVAVDDRASLLTLIEFTKYKPTDMIARVRPADWLNKFLRSLIQEMVEGIVEGYSEDRLEIQETGPYVCGNVRDDSTYFSLVVKESYVKEYFDWRESSDEHL